jgi:hypothetical protein
LVQFLGRRSDGYYINNFAVSVVDDFRNTWIEQMAGALANKQLFYESDMSSTRDDDEAKLNILSRHFDVKYAALNKDGGVPGPRFSAERIAGLKTGGYRPVLAMEGPWLVDGAMNSQAAIPWKEAIVAMDGSATDGPLGYWHNDFERMRKGTADSVYYAHSLEKLSMVMLAAHSSESGQRFLEFGQGCVRWLEQQGALPDIWAISYYDSNGEWYPVAPESEASGHPAGTITGLAYWLIDYQRKPRRVSIWPHPWAARHAQWREIPASDGYVLLENRSLATYLEVKNGDASNPALVGVYKHIENTPHGQWKVTGAFDRYLTIKDRVHNRHLQVSDASVADNADVSVYAHSGNPDHALWKKIDRGNGWFSLVPKHLESTFLQIDASIEY